MNNYYNGKLLLTGEYSVLHGASALATPVNKGQSFCISYNKIDNNIRWKAYNHSNLLWFYAEIDTKNLTLIRSNHKKISKTLLNILFEAKRINPSFLSEDCGYNVESRINYPANWGLGSSATLIAAVADWAKINSYELNKRTFKSSGYDIACTKANSPIIYKISNEGGLVTPVKFNLNFADKLYFVYLNKKQNSKSEVKNYLKRYKTTDNDTILEISKLTYNILYTETLSEFETYVLKHELITAKAIGKTPIKESIFSDLDGCAKSLGAWGGDFCLVSWHKDYKSLKNYLNSKNFDVFFAFNDLILNK